MILQECLSLFFGFFPFFFFFVSLKDFFSFQSPGYIFRLFDILFLLFLNFTYHLPSLFFIRKKIFPLSKTNCNCVSSLDLFSHFFSWFNFLGKLFRFETILFYILFVLFFIFQNMYFISSIFLSFYSFGISSSFSLFSVLFLFSTFSLYTFHPTILHFFSFYYVSFLSYFLSSVILEIFFPLRIANATPS